ncbi:response regulator transcription factor [Prolixibacteraceae bacterium JC049]|nr:response regulator transcription factor [Prolixibacteraceae bacterium JC049]
MNCLIIDDDKLSRSLIEKCIKKTSFIRTYKSFSSAVDAINHIQKSDEIIDLIFLDIEMPEMTGVEFLKVLQDQTPQIIFVSGKEDYALEAFELDVTDYLLKPINLTRFYKAVEKAWKKNRSAKIEITDDYDEFFIKKNNNLVRVRYSDIIWVEALENYITINTFNEKYTIHHTLKAIVDKLPPGKFFRIHRSYVVNASKINMISSNSVEVETDEGKMALPLGKSFRDKLLNGINVLSK